MWKPVFVLHNGLNIYWVILCSGLWRKSRREWGDYLGCHDYGWGKLPSLANLLGFYHHLHAHSMSSFKIWKFCEGSNPHSPMWVCKHIIANYFIPSLTQFRQVFPDDYECWSSWSIAVSQRSNPSGKACDGAHRTYTTGWQSGLSICTVAWAPWPHQPKHRQFFAGVSSKPPEASWLLGFVNGAANVHYLAFQLHALLKSCTVPKVLSKVPITQEWLRARRKEPCHWWGTSYACLFTQTHFTLKIPT